MSANNDLLSKVESKASNTASGPDDSWHYSGEQATLAYVI